VVLSREMMECGSVKRAEETEQVYQDCEPSGQKGIPAGGDRNHRLTDPLTQVIPPTQKEQWKRVTESAQPFM